MLVIVDLKDNTGGFFFLIKSEHFLLENEFSDMGRHGGGFAGITLRSFFLSADD